MFNRKNKIFYTKLIFIALPIVLQEFLNSSVNMMDTFMIGRLGEQPVAAVGLANQIFFLFNLLSFGINSGAAIFMGQYWGKGDIKNIHKIMGISFMLCLFCSFIFFVCANIIPKTIMGIYSKDEEVIKIGVNYLKVVGISYFFMSIILTLNNSLKVIGKTYFPMITTFISLMSNIAFNYLFIFVFKLGVTGAAYGTVCARTIELLCIIFFILRFKIPVLTKIKNYFSFDFKYLRWFLAAAVPVILNEFAWALGTTVYNIAYKYSGTNAQAAIQIVSTIQNLFVVVGMGIGSGCAIMITNTLGAKDFKKAIYYSRKCLVISVLTGAFMGIVLMLLSNFIISLFDVNDIVKKYCKLMLYMVSIGISLKSFNFAAIIGVLRSGADTKFCLFADLLTVWFIGIPMAFLGSYFLHLPIYITFCLVYLEEAAKIFICLPRVLKNKWAKTVI